ncbi:PepSY-associated TM helix domain-containing protein [Aliikangiella sp. IMCC44359]|uniref:PepSY-associated TM helix domain-containing protein n=1 Tax=Aliikangiella sp. IMCC44359 TaxID=3459125 RepID=UPI00403B2897
MKTIIKKLHLIIAVFASVFIINLSLSGAILVFAKDIQYWFNPQFWLIDTEQAFDKKHLSLNRLLTHVEASTDEKVVRVDFPKQKNVAWQFQLANRETISINPFSGKILLRYRFDETFYGFVHLWHRWLLYSNKKGEHPLRDYVSVATVALMINLILGIWLWCQLKKKWKHLQPKHGGNKFLTRFSYHNLIGVVVFIPLLLVAFSGLTFHWKWPKSVVELLTFSEVLTGGNAVRSGEPANQAIDFQAAMEKAQAVLPGAIIYRVSLPNKNGHLITFRVKTDSEFHAYSKIWIEPYSLEVVKVFEAAKTTAATKIWNFRYSFHIGDFFHVSVKFLWVVIALTPLVFIYTGFSMYFIRMRKKQVVKQKRQADFVAV